jgi:galactose mutarotase-like enzyme
MEVYTEEPGMQFYTGNFMYGFQNALKSGAKDDKNRFFWQGQHFLEQASFLL